MTVAPAAIEQLNSTLAARTDKPATYTFDGIVGDPNHIFGYHCSRNQLFALGAPDDYSLTLPRDAVGAAAFPDDASAWDLGLGPDDMRLVTGRLVAAALAKDPRITSAVREFAGTTNGTTVHPFDVASGFDDVNNTEGWDDSHLWHVHISFYRDISNQFDVMQGVLDVICGTPSTLTPSRQEDMVVRFQKYTTLDGTKPIKNRDAVYLVVFADGIGVSQEWLQTPDILKDRQGRAAAAGNKDTAVTVSNHSRGYFGPIVGTDPEA